MTDKEKLEKIKVLADAMYNAAFNITTDASRLKKAMYDYHQFIINEYYKEEPVSRDLEEAANDYAHDFVHDDVFETFIAGALWQKQQMIDKACQFLKEYQEYPNHDISTNNLLEAFKMYMEIRL